MTRHPAGLLARAGAAAVVIAAAAAAFVVAPPTDPSDPGGASGPGVYQVPAGLGGLVPGVDGEEAALLLEQLLVVDRVDLPGYDRDAYGEAWADVDGNGCNQRDDVLLRDAVAGSVRLGVQGGCDHDVLAGEWADPYTGNRVHYDDLKDPAQAQALSIDHIVPLAEAHRSGAAGWDQHQRVTFANDLGNLVAADGSENAAKGDQDPATWRPPAPVGCAYAVTWITVKHGWGLAVDAAERAALETMLATCSPAGGSDR